MSNFGCLPDIALHKIIKYLPVPDVFSLRLTCYRFSEIAKCKELFGRVQIHISKVEKHGKESFDGLCQEFASHIRFNAEGCVNDTFKLILPYINKVEDVIVDAKHLRDVCMEGKQIKKLTINFMRYDDLEDQDDVDFACLASLNDLSDLNIKSDGNYNNKFLFDKSMLYDVILNATSLSKLSFQNLHIQGRDLCRHPDENEFKDTLKKLISTASHIKEWYLDHVYVESGLFQLPNDIRVLECRYTKGVIFDHYSFHNLEKLVIECVIFKNLRFNFPKLKILEINGDLIIGKTMFCPELEELYLIRIGCILRYQQLFSDSLKILFISSRNSVNDEVQHFVRSRCVSLTQLTFRTYEESFHGIPYCSSREPHFYRRELRQVFSSFFSRFKCSSESN